MYPDPPRTAADWGKRTMAHSAWPEAIRDVEELEDLLSRPTPAAVRALASLEGDIIILGVGGKMGPTLARMVRRATVPLRFDGFRVMAAQK